MHDPCVIFLGSPISIKAKNNENITRYVDKINKFCIYLVDPALYIFHYFLNFDVDFLLHVDQRLPEFFIVFIYFLFITHHTIFLN